MTGCMWTIRKETSKKGSMSCGAIRQDGSDFFPKHKVMFEGEEEDNKRRMAKVRAHKERRKIMRDALVDSPLRAYNPEFEAKKRGAYSA